MDKVLVNFTIDAGGTPDYFVSYNGREIIKPSATDSFYLTETISVKIFKSPGLLLFQLAPGVAAGSVFTSWKCCIYTK
ncbi:MAG TPA: hypothetical protein VG847_04960 [Chitinophagaceae bacterium]|nr:hypothetical protein [Chitinophagaceae bacterium]